MEWLKSVFIDKAKVAKAIGMSRQLLHSKTSDKYSNKLTESEKARLENVRKELIKELEK